MKKTVTKKIPAVKARPAKTVEKEVTVCDFDGKPSADHYGNERRCMRCGRDICRKHQTYDPDEVSDYGSYYCPICIKLYNDKYQSLYYELREKQYEEEENFWLELKKESLNEPTRIA